MELTLPDYAIQAITPEFLFTGLFQPRGEMITFTNDRRFIFYTFNDAEMYPLEPGYQVNCLQQATINLSRNQIAFLALQRAEDVKKVQVLAFKRPAIFYSAGFAIQGNIHANPDFKDNDLVDDTRDFIPLSDVTIFPLKPIIAPLNREVPMVLINRLRTTGYHVYKPE